MEHGIDFEGERRRLTRWAWGVTIGYGCILIILAALVFFGQEGLDSFRTMSPNEVGDLLAGIAGPLAFIWLVYGYFLQGIAIRQQAKELSQNTRALNLQEEALRAQVEELKNSVEHQRELAAAASIQAKAQVETISAEKIALKKACALNLFGFLTALNHLMQEESLSSGLRILAITQQT